MAGSGWRSHRFSDEPKNLSPSFPMPHNPLTHPHDCGVATNGPWGADGRGEGRFALGAFDVVIRATSARGWRRSIRHKTHRMRRGGASHSNQHEARLAACRSRFNRRVFARPAFEAEQMVSLSSHEGMAPRVLWLRSTLSVARGGRREGPCRSNPRAPQGGGRPRCWAS